MSDNFYIHGSSQEEQARLSTLNALLNQSCLVEMNIRVGDHILDLGSGLGQFARMMAGQTGSIGRVLGIERDVEQLRAAREIAIKEGEQYLVEFRQGDAHMLPLSHNEWGTFDLVHARFVLEHIPVPSKVLAQMIKAARIGGRVIICDDDHSLLRITPESSSIDDLWKAYYMTFEKLGNDPFTGRKLVSLMYALGLRKINNKMIFFGSSAEQENFKDFGYNFINVIKGAKDSILEHRIMTPDRFETCFQELEKWQKRPDAAIWYTLCWAEGVKI